MRPAPTREKRVSGSRDPEPVRGVGYGSRMHDDLFDRLAGDPRLGLSRDEIAALVKSPMEFTGAARAQVAGVSERVSEITAAYPQAAAYSPGAIL